MARHSITVDFEEVHDFDAFSRAYDQVRAAVDASTPPPSWEDVAVDFDDVDTTIAFTWQT